MSGIKEKPVHWSKQKEQAAGYWHLKFLLTLFQIFPVIILRILAFPVGFFYFLFSKRGRNESKRFLHKAAPLIGNPKTAKKCLSRIGPLRHIISFSLALVEKLQSWGNKYSFNGIHFQNDTGELIKSLENNEGVFLIGSHLGNMELLRALANNNLTGVSRNVPVTAIYDIKVNKHFSRMIKELNPESVMDLIGTNEIGPQTAVLLEEKLASGGLISMSGDRTSANSFGKNIIIPFLGEDAPFPSGPFYLAVLLNAPVYFIFALRRGDLSLKPEYDMHVHKINLSEGAALNKSEGHSRSRKERASQSYELAKSFAALLESYCKKSPFQWYNFYDFWSEGV